MISLRLTLFPGGGVVWLGKEIQRQTKILGEKRPATGGAQIVILRINLHKNNNSGSILSYQRTERMNLSRTLGRTIDRLTKKRGGIKI